MSASSILVETVVPILGCILASVMNFIPMLVMRSIRSSANIGNGNPMLWTSKFICSFSWVLYGAIISNYYLMSGSVVGTLVGLFACSTSFSVLGVLSHKTDPSVARRYRLQILQMEILLEMATVIWIILGYLILTTDSKEKAAFYPGVFCMITTILMYAFPLVNLIEIIQTKNAYSLQFPEVLASLANSTLWLTYGMVIRDVVVYTPSLLGVVVSSLSIVLLNYYPSIHPQYADETVKETPNGDGKENDLYFEAGRERKDTIIDFLEHVTLDAVSLFQEGTEAVLHAIEEKAIEMIPNSYLPAELAHSNRSRENSLIGLPYSHVGTSDVTMVASATAVPEQEAEVRRRRTLSNAYSPTAN